MIVGVKNIDTYDVREHCKSVEDLRAYSDSLVPRVLRHDKRIINNQRYLVALVVRTIKSIPYVRRQVLCSGLLEGVSVCGLANRLFDLEDILASIDIDRLAMYIMKRG